MGVVENADGFMRKVTREMASYEGGGKGRE
jgi:hypothetical protein